MQTLADFKRFLEANKGNEKVKLSSTIRSNANGQPIKENTPAPVEIVQTNSFAVKRGATLSWMEFGKAKEWTFYRDKEGVATALHNTRPNNPKFCNIEFKIHGI